MNQAAVRDAGVQLPYYYKRNPAKKQDIIQSRPHSKIVWAALRLSYTEKGSTQARPSSHAAMLSAAKLIYGYRGCRFRRLLSLPLLPEVQNRYTFFFGRVVAFNKSLDDARCGGVHHFKCKGNTAQFPPYGLSTAPAAAARHLRCQNAR